MHLQPHSRYFAQFSWRRTQKRYKQPSALRMKSAISWRSCLPPAWPTLWPWILVSLPDVGNCEGFPYQTAVSLVTVLQAESHTHWGKWCAVTKVIVEISVEMLEIWSDSQPVPPVVINISVARSAAADGHSSERNEDTPGPRFWGIERWRKWRRTTKRTEGIIVVETKRTRQEKQKNWENGKKIR
jgi:hypothetical protein